MFLIGFVLKHFWLVDSYKFKNCDLKLSLGFNLKRDGRRMIIKQAENFLLNGFPTGKLTPNPKNFPPQISPLGKFLKFPPREFPPKENSLPENSAHRKIPPLQKIPP